MVTGTSMAVRRADSGPLIMCQMESDHLAVQRIGRRKGPAGLPFFISGGSGGVSGQKSTAWPFHSMQSKKHIVITIYRMKIRTEAIAFFHIGVMILSIVATFDKTIHSP